MKHSLKIASTALALMLPLSSAHSANVIHSGTVASTCVLTVGTPGILAANANSSVLGSKESGGLKSIVTAVSTGAAFNITAASPASFTVAPSNGNDNVTFLSEYQLGGATSSGRLAGTIPTPLNIGVTTVDVDLTATKSSGVFPQGLYTATTVVTCE